ncbi:hypothetical protein RND81_05G137300 [Saponaria officinalis]|uniref:F-box domain-containing protein n=1 Tax=Saponaria officinalis TaxID=3572 RepID=A0AAW1KYV0_SAPOF
MNGEECKKLALRKCKMKWYTATSIDDLNDELLIEILCRLPCYIFALRCKIVSKRWCSLISDPLFVTQGFSIHRKINQDETSWTLLLTKKMQDTTNQATITATTFWLRILTSPNFSLQFLPTPSQVVATCRDLFLCSSFNLLTVVVVHSIPMLRWDPLETFRSFNLLIYSSDTGEWKNIDVLLPMRPNNEGCRRVRFSSIVCKGMVCLRHYSYFGAFNPFDVTPTFHGPLIAIGLPLPKIDGELLESCGKLVALDPNLDLKLNSEGNSALVTLRWPIWKLDLMPGNEQPLTWKLVSLLFDNVKVEGPILAPRGVGHIHRLQVFTVHPTKEYLVYFITPPVCGQNQTILCNTRSEILKPLTRMSPLKILALEKLNTSYWPMPFPEASSTSKTLTIFRTNDLEVIDKE